MTAFTKFGIEDLVKAKKTEMDEEFRESRTPEILIELAAGNPEVLQQMFHERPLLAKRLGAILRARTRAQHRGARARARARNRRVNIPALRLENSVELHRHSHQS